MTTRPLFLESLSRGSVSFATARRFDRERVSNVNNRKGAEDEERAEQMVERQLDNGLGVVVVRFRLPTEIGADTAFVVGDFNDWSTSSHAMRREDGAFVADVSLEPGRAYRFRYLLDGQRWENDWTADAYAPNEYGGDDSVIDLTELPRSIPPTATEPKPRATRRARKSEPAS